MKISKKCTGLIVAALLAVQAGCGAASADRETIHQVALLQSLAQGYLGGNVTVKQVRASGDTGIGTFKGVNGEMIVLDGTVYQALGDGRVVVADDRETVPFGNVTFFDSDIAVRLFDVADKAAFEKRLNEAVKKNGVNSFYMVKLHTRFPSILYRSEYGSHEPYPTLVEALKDKQTEFTGKNIEGTVVGLYCPPYMGGLNSTGWHFHFLSDDRKHGGHVLELSVKNGRALLDKTDNFSMLIHDDAKFHGLNLAKNMDKDIRSAEQDTKGSMGKAGK